MGMQNSQQTASKFQMSSQYHMNQSAQLGGISPAGAQFNPNTGGVRQTSPYQQHPSHPGAGSIPRPNSRPGDQSSLVTNWNNTPGQHPMQQHMMSTRGPHPNASALMKGGPTPSYPMMQQRLTASPMQMQGAGTPTGDS